MRCKNPIWLCFKISRMNAIDAVYEITLFMRIYNVTLLLLTKRSDREVKVERCVESNQCCEL